MAQITEKLNVAPALLASCFADDRDLITASSLDGWKVFCVEMEPSRWDGFPGRGASWRETSVSVGACVAKKRRSP
jgi:hypothetical protein